MPISSVNRRPLLSVSLVRQQRFGELTTAKNSTQNKTLALETPGISVNRLALVVQERKLCADKTTQASTTQLMF